ncbi:DUF1501 domain-containing protein [Microscilla marina]|uniref:DUF1501 domain-containing protein n=1 Tax=Microscilla marina ATCC 23134 TaxID=313606 RepID=A1ZPN0_MICM2|nr:DUF1501 domain-containing protein [Microscilla marina]EAY27769.1 conserved hypothetical protein [Microscilla marina ATCC 23134]
MNRREFVVGCSAAITAMAGSQLESFAFAPEPNAQKDIFVFVFLRGGCDALNLVAPVDDRHYVAARPAFLRVTEQGKNQGLRLKNSWANQDFRLHGKASALHELYQSNQLAIIHACGLSNGTRSHFDAMDMIERGVNQKQNSKDGWLTRYLRTAQLEGMLPAMAAETNLPASFIGSNQAASIKSVKDFKVNGDPRFLGILKTMYQGDSLLAQTAQQTIETLNYINKKIAKDSKGRRKKYQPSNGVKYPDRWKDGGLGQSLQTVAQIMKMDVGLQVATVSLGGWDTHENQAFHFPRKVEGLSQALSAFYKDVANYQKRLTILVMSEFGRRLKANKSNGTDHGHGGIALALGGNVNGGKIYGKWPGLATEQLDKRVDLDVTTDYRSVLSEVLQKRMASQRLTQIFPGFDAYQPLGFV